MKAHPDSADDVPEVCSVPLDVLPRSAPACGDHRKEHRGQMFQEARRDRPGVVFPWPVRVGQALVDYLPCMQQDRGEGVHISRGHRFIG